MLAGLGSFAAVTDHGKDVLSSRETADERVAFACQRSLANVVLAGAGVPGVRTVARATEYPFLREPGPTGVRGSSSGAGR